MINDTTWSSCSPPGCLWLETNMCHYWWDYEWLNSQDLNKHRNISFQKKTGFFSAWNQSRFQRPFGQPCYTSIKPKLQWKTLVMKNRPWKRWFLRWKRSQHGWKKGWQNNDRTMRKISDRHDLYKGDNIGIYTYIYIYIQNLFLNPFVTLLGLPLHAAVESIAKHAIPSVGSGDQRLQNFTNLECHV